MSNKARFLSTLALVTGCCLAGCGDGLKIDAVSPDQGAARGGELVVISGSGFGEDSRVWFGDREATSVTLLESGELQVLTPAATAGRVAVSVASGGAQVSREGGFTYQPLALRFVAAASHYLPDLGDLAISAATTGDFDGDGDQDVLVASRTGISRVLLGNGAGSFTDSLPPPIEEGGDGEEDPVAPAEPLLAWSSDTREVVAADFDDDGDLDVFACTAGAAESRLFLNQGGSFSEITGSALPPSTARCVQAAAADLDGDGLLDLALIGVERGTSARHLEVLTNRGGDSLGFDFAAGLATPRAVAGEPVGGTWASVAEIAATFTLADEPVAEGAGSGQMHYDLSAAAAGGRVQVYLDAPSATPAPEAMELDLYGDGSGHQLYLEITDSSGEYFFTESGAIDWTGWRRVRVDGLSTWNHTGGNDDGIIDAPVVRATVGLVASDPSPAVGDLYLDNLVLEAPDGMRTLIEDFERLDRRHRWTDTISSIAIADLDSDHDADLLLSSNQADATSHLRMMVNKSASGGDEGSAALTFNETDAYSLPTLPDPVSRVVLLDADHDGDLDALAVVTAGQDRLLVNDGAGYFFDATTSALPVDRVDGRGAAVADLDLDGYPDLAIANHGDTNRLYVSRGDGSFADQTPAMPLDSQPSATVLALDADNDGDRDLLVVNDSAPALELLVSVPEVAGMMVPRGAGAAAKPPAARSVVPPPPAGTVIAHLPWGGTGYAVGKLEGNESSPEGPMSFTLAADGLMYVLDQVNLRVLALRSDGTIAREIPIPTATFQDLAVSPDGSLILLDRLAESALVVIDPNGKTAGEFPVVGEGISEGGGVTAMFARPDGVWLEFGHTYVVRVLGRDLTPCTREVQPGRILVRGKRSVSAAIDYQGGARLWLGDLETGAITAETEIRLPDRIARIIWIEPDAAGHLHVMVHLLDFDEFDFHKVTVDKVVGLEYDADLNLLDSFESPHVIVEYEQFREFLVTEQGGVYQMALGDDGMSLVRWR